MIDWFLFIHLSIDWLIDWLIDWWCIRGSRLIWFSSLSRTDSSLLLLLRLLCRRALTCEYGSSFYLLLFDWFVHLLLVSALLITIIDYILDYWLFYVLIVTLCWWQTAIITNKTYIQKKKRLKKENESEY